MRIVRGLKRLRTTGISHESLQEFLHPQVEGKSSGSLATARQHAVSTAQQKGGGRGLTGRTGKSHFVSQPSVTLFLLRSHFVPHQLLLQGAQSSL